MSAKPELSATQGIQNVVVYVSNDNFAQAYAVGQQNVQQGAHQVIPNEAYPPHSMAPVAQQKCFSDKVKPPDYPSNGFFSSNAVISQNGFSVNNLTDYQNINVLNQIKNAVAYTGGGSTEILSGDRDSGPGRPEMGKVRVDECDYLDSNCVVLGPDGQGVRCESVRSETAESSCSSLSSADEGIVVVPHSQEMVVFDSSGVSVRHGGVVLTVGPNGAPQQQSSASVIGTVPQLQPAITVPFGWKRLLNNGAIVYISPSNTALSSLEQLKEYLLTPGTCKCGLECPLKFDTVFNFDPKVPGKPWTLSPDTNTGDLTKLCNHKRKIMSMASLECKPPDPAKLSKDFNNKRKKRKVCGPYSGVSVSQILAQREKMGLFQQQQQFGKEISNQAQHQQIWSQPPVNVNLNMQGTQNRLQGYQENQPQSNSGNQQFFRYQNQGQDGQQINRVMSGSPVVIGEAVMVQQPQQQTINISTQQHANVSPQQNQLQHHMPSGPQQPQSNSPNVHIHHHQVIAPNGQLISIQRSLPNQILAQNNVVVQQTSPHQRIIINGQPTEPSGPGRPGIQMVPITISGRPDVGQRLQQQPFYSQPAQYQVQQGIRPSFLQNNQTSFPSQISTGISTNVMNHHHAQHQHQKMWQNRMHAPQQNQIPIPMQSPQNGQIEQRVPPLHQHTPPPNMWQDDGNRKKVKVGKIMKKRPYIIDQQNGRIIEVPCPNIDVRQMQNDHGNRVHLQHPGQGTSSPSFMEDPSGYLAQQTALLNSTINRQTGANGCTNFNCNSPIQTVQTPSSQHNMSPMNQQSNGVPLPSNMLTSSSTSSMPLQMKPNSNYNMKSNQNGNIIHVMKQPISQNIANAQQPYHQLILPQEVVDSSEHQQCGCTVDSGQYQDGNQYHHQHQHSVKIYQTQRRPDSQPSTPSSSGTNEDPVTSSTYNEKPNTSPDSRPIQGGTVSTSNVSPQGDSPGPSHTPTPMGRDNQVHQQQFVFSTHSINQSRENQSKLDGYYCQPHDVQIPKITNLNTGIVTTMASGRTVGSNTITSVLAGKTNTATVSINTPPAVPLSSNNQIPHNSIITTLPTNSITVNVTKSPLEMVQSVVSSIQVPHIQGQISPQQIGKPQHQSFPSGSILVSSGGQLIMANTSNNQGVMAPPPPKIVTNQNSMPPISVSPMITNVTAAMTQVIPAVAAQQVLGQQTVLVNTLPGPFVLQPGVTMTMDGMAQIPQLLAGNVIHQQQIQIDNSDPRRATALLSPETKRKGKKRKIPSQTVASMLHIAAQQNSGVVMSPQGFSQQIQMAHSPQSVNTTPVMQALTIVPGKGGAPPQIVMNGQAMASTGHIGTQQLITNSQPAQQINLLQPVNLLNGGMVQNFPTIQQFIVPNLGGMVMNADGTATLLQDTSNIGMQLQLQNVNGQNVLTPVQNSNVFNGGQSILTAGPAGMVIRAPNTPQGKIIQQQHSPGAQFLSPNGGQFVVNGTQFSGQLSPLVANVSPPQQVTFNTTPQAIRPANNVQQGQQEYIQCGQMGQTLMVPCTPAGNIAVSSSNQQNTTFVQQNTTIVQQQTTMVSNNQQLQNFQQSNPSNNQQNLARTTTLNVDQNFIITSNDKQQPVQALVFQRQSPQASVNYRQSVSTQTAVNQNTQSVTTNTFCQTSTSSASSPPDTTTHSPLAFGGQSPPTADTTTHTGSTDDGLSPAPSNSSGSCGDIVTLQQNRQQNCSMAMVHCVSSSEPDSAELGNQNSEMEWNRAQVHCAPKMEFTDISSLGQMNQDKKGNNPIHMAYAESSTIVSGMHIMPEQMKSHEGVVSSRNYEKYIHRRKHSDALVVLETRHQMYDDEGECERTDPKRSHNFVVGDLVWGAARGSPAWPGKVELVSDDKVQVRWFGGDKSLTEVDPANLQTLSEGLDAHHRARKRSRTSRKLNTQLENAIQEAMAELDKKSDANRKEKRAADDSPVKKISSRLRSSQR